jgi:hypothetical protein
MNLLLLYRNRHGWLDLLPSLRGLPCDIVCVTSWVFATLSISSLSSLRFFGLISESYFLKMRAILSHGCPHLLPPF